MIMGQLWQNINTGKLGSMPKIPAWVDSPDEKHVQIPNPELKERFDQGWRPVMKKRGKRRVR